MTTETLTYHTDNQDFDAVVFRPKGAGDHPAVLVCHAWGGRDEFAEAKAEALTELGYVGVAIDVYGVGIRGTDKASNQALMMPLVSEPARLRARLQAGFEAVQKLDGVDADRVGAIGYCFGGLCSLLLARMGLPLKGVVSFHGLLKVGEELDATPSAPMLVLHGQDDPMVPSSDLAAFADEMKRVGARWQLSNYPGAVHAFTVPSANDPDFGTVYHAGADELSWAEMTRFFADVL